MPFMNLKDKNIKTMENISLKIKVLGNGAAINDGLPYNAFVINETLLCETPPDIMLSINKHSIEVSSIKVIYISHLHGDHIFGFPFLLLTAFFTHITSDKKLTFKIIGPKGLEMMLENLVVSAFTSKHPCFKWMKDFCTFIEVDETSNPDLVKGFKTSLFKLDHLIETYGFSIARENNIIDFAYVADTRWCESVYSLLCKKPKTVLIDLNGKEDDPKPIHLSIGDLAQKAIPITGEDTMYYATHLKKEFNSPISCVICTKPGMEINVRE